MRILLASLLLILGMVSCTPEKSQVVSPSGGWTDLFNGKNLDGWIPKITGHEVGDNFANTFRVEDGILTVNYDGYDGFDGDFGHLFYEKLFSKYRLRFEYRFIGEQVEGGPGWALKNSGVMVHGQPAATMGIDQDFPISIEVQLLGGTGEGDRPTANLCTPGTNVVLNGVLDTRHCITANAPTIHDDRWVQAEVWVDGDSLIVHYINGQEVLRYTHPQIGGGNVAGHDASLKNDGQLLSSGSISFQSESHPVQFRKIQLLDLSK